MSWKIDYKEYGASFFFVFFFGFIFNASKITHVTHGGLSGAFCNKVSKFFILSRQKDKELNISGREEDCVVMRSRIGLQCQSRQNIFPET